MSIYNRRFYEDREEKTIRAARAIIDTFEERLGKPSLVVDVGCGNGVFLRVAKDKFGAKIIGYDASWVPKDTLVISDDEFHEVDLQKNMPMGKLSKRADLGICLEVVEHVNDLSGKNIIKWLMENCKTVLFSAAVPGQGGKGHINERPQSYWVVFFQQQGWFCNDIIRWRLWEDENIPYWYKQNTFLFTPDPITAHSIGHPKLDVIHPDVLLIRKEQIRKLKRNQRKKLGDIPTAIMRRLRSLFSTISRRSKT